MNLNPPPNPSVFPNRKQVTAALERAAQKARLLAEQTGTMMIVINSSKPLVPLIESAGSASNTIANTQK
ncbi:MAG: hypothetical protein RIR79_1386 [Pseudomonadota bacterium]|jgi:16S rRNA G1207 methylase RsmC